MTYGDRMRDSPSVLSSPEGSTRQPVPRRTRSARWFTAALVIALIGYVLFSRAFAWLHISGIPIFFGEVVLVLAVAVLIQHQRQLQMAVAGSALLKVAAALFLWGVLRLAWDLSEFGMAAARDAAMTNYVLIGVAVAALTVARPLRIATASPIVRLAPIVVVIWAPLAVVVNRLFASSLPTVPDSETSIVSFAPDGLALWTAAAVTFVWLPDSGYSRRTRAIVTAIGILGLLVIATQNRGGALGALVILGVSATSLPREQRRRAVAGVVGVAAAVILSLAVTGTEVSLGSRSVSAHQLFVNAQSLSGRSGDSGLQGSITWRLEYWEAIVDDVLLGDEWIAGIGYGPILPDRYGFQTRGAGSSQPLRNAHNSHVTVIARLGAVGLALWMLLWLQVGATSLRSRVGPLRYAIGWLVAVAAGVAVAAIFDPILEGPQVAIPFWVIVGMLSALSARSQAELVS